MPAILFLCRANLARSAWAELLMRSALSGVPGSDHVEISSAGTWTPGGQPIWPPAGQEALAMGLDPSAFRSTALHSVDLDRQSVILAATRALRDEVLQRAPSTQGRIFTMRELAHLVAAVPTNWNGSTLTERVEALPAVALRNRSQVSPLPPEALDIADPAGRPAEVVHRCATETRAMIGQLTTALLA